MQKNRKNLCLLYAVSFLQGMVFYAPVAMLYRQAAHMTVTQTAVTESVCLAVSVFLEVPWGILADVIGYRRTLQICAVVSFLSKIVFWKAEGFAGFLTERILLGIVTAGLLTASAVCTVLTGGFSAGLTRRLGAKRVTLLCFLLAAAGCGVLAGTENFLLSVGAVLLVQVCFRMFWPLQMSIQNKRAAPGNRATALSMNSLLMNLTACSVNPVFGKLADAGLPLVMTAGFLCCLAGAVLLPFFGDKKEKRAGKEESVVR